MVILLSCRKAERCEASGELAVSRRTSGIHNRIYPVAMRPGDTPVPIPNTKVKTWTADGTILETVWESRWLPDL